MEPLYKILQLGINPSGQKRTRSHSQFTGDVACKIPIENDFTIRYCQKYCKRMIRFAASIVRIQPNLMNLDRLKVAGLAATTLGPNNKLPLLRWCRKPANISRTE